MQANAADEQPLARLYSVLERRGHLKTWFARECGISLTYLMKMATGEKPVSRRFIDDAARVLLLPPEVLFDERLLQTCKPEPQISQPEDAA